MRVIHIIYIFIEATNTAVVFAKTHFVIIIIRNEYTGRKTNNGDEPEKNPARVYLYMYILIHVYIYIYIHIYIYFIIIIYSDEIIKAAAVLKIPWSKYRNIIIIIIREARVPCFFSYFFSAGRRLIIFSYPIFRPSTLYLYTVFDTRYLHYIMWVPPPQ